MKILLQKDHKKIGHKGDVVDVSDAYALNAIVPQGIGVIATPEILSRVEKESVKQQAEKKADLQLSHDLAQKLKGGHVTIVQKASGGKLFGAVKNAVLARSINQAYDVTIVEPMLLLKHSLKTLGEHEISIDCGHGVQTTMTVDIQG